MSLLKIFEYPDPILKEKTSPVENIDGRINGLIDDMIETMYHAVGIGLAAPQVGESINLAVLDVPMTKDYVRGDNLMVLINPEIQSHEGETTYEEGCLSIPKYTIQVPRWAKVVVKALDRNGNDMSLDAEGLLAIAIQHEVDHLNGILIINRISGLKRSIFERKLKKASA
jgi:peptide deformylase